MTINFEEELEKVNYLKELMNHKIVVQDPVDLDKQVECTILLIEPDQEFMFVYLRADDEKENIHWEPKLGMNIHTVIELSMIANNKNCYVKYED